MEWVWVDQDVVLAVHEAQIAEHGGASGVRHTGLLESALARPLNLDAYGRPDAAALAAAYACGIARNHPFIDGNKRTALVIAETFLELNDSELKADNVACVDTMLQVAAGTMDEDSMAEWIRANL